MLLEKAGASPQIDMTSRSKTARAFATRSPRRRTTRRLWRVAWCLFLALEISLQADPFDSLRLYWQTNLINSGGNSSTTANGYWTSMNTSPTRTNLWSDLSFGPGFPSANIVSTFQRLQAMELPGAAPP